jgi:lipoate-protein ligase A
LNVPHKTETLRWWSSFGAPPELDLAREESLLEAAASRPQLFTFSWEKPALVLGYGQRDLASLNLDLCRREGIRVLRRCSGGTAVYQRLDLSLSLALSSSHRWAAGIRALYGRFAGTLQESLGRFGLEAGRPPEPRTSSRTPICFEGRGDDTLLVEGRKVAGGAQARRKEAVLIHLVVLFALDAALQADLFNVPRDRIERAMAPLPPRPGLSPSAIAETFATCLSKRLECPLEAEGAPPSPAGASTRLHDPRWVLVP